MTDLFRSINKGKMKQFFTYSVIIIFMLSLAGCFRPDPDRPEIPIGRKVLGLIHNQQFIPRAYRDQHFDHTPNDPTKSYDRGWMDGCQTATSAIGTGLARLRGPKIDGYELTEDQWYLRGFQDANTYCTLTLDWETH